MLKKHSESYVCAAVSALVINAANSIEKFTDADISLDMKIEGGYLSFKLPEIANGFVNEKASLLLASLELGIKSISEQYEGKVYIKEEML